MDGKADGTTTKRITVAPNATQSFPIKCNQVLWCDVTVTATLTPDSAAAIRSSQQDTPGVEVSIAPVPNTSATLLKETRGNAAIGYDTDWALVTDDDTNRDHDGPDGRPTTYTYVSEPPPPLVVQLKHAGPKDALTVNVISEFADADLQLDVSAVWK
jgi:hypothetical protein